MDRFFLRRRLGALPFLLLTVSFVLSTAGCRHIFSTVAYLVYGTNVDAEFDGLKNKRVAVIVRSDGPGRSIDQNRGANELAKRLGVLLDRTVSGIEVVDQQDVDNWMDNLRNDEADIQEVGKALEADMVVVIDLERFRLYDNSTSVYRGRADYHIEVYDLKGKRDKPVYDFQPDQQAVYPPSMGIPTGTLRRMEFRRIFVNVLADEIGRHFYSHDSTAHFARDSESLQYH